MSPRDKIISKIRKCLALSASSNEHEAAAALRQARAMMEEHRISEAELAAAEAGEFSAKARAQRPTAWETFLADVCGRPFACQVILVKVLTRPLDVVSTWRWIGCGPGPELAGYAFSVLMRQCLRARADYIKSRLSRCLPASKVKRADVFCEGWVSVVARAVEVLDPSPRESGAIRAYLAERFPCTHNLDPRDRNAGGFKGERAYHDYVAGLESGKDAQLHHGVGSAGEGRRQIQ